MGQVCNHWSHVSQSTNHDKVLLNFLEFLVIFTWAHKLHVEKADIIFVLLLSVTMRFLHVYPDIYIFYDSCLSASRALENHVCAHNWTFMKAAIGLVLVLYFTVQKLLSITTRQKIVFRKTNGRLQIYLRTYTVYLHTTTTFLYMFPCLKFSLPLGKIS